ncbi:putative T7SS-secreted protein [Saccharopolyspora spinosa]|uniref:putative T7SS-secreted protein n=1 Tax=Saccharopolyspora spinosa TaxID=60894 RepID=UPI000237B0F7|nr:hypothetical protein [Saccharopolyspora spinosa]
MKPPISSGTCSTGSRRSWLEAGDCFRTASKALDGYIFTLMWAQSQVAEAIRLWNEGQAATRQATAEHDQAVRQAPHGTPVILFTDPGEAQQQGVGRASVSTAVCQ